MNRSESIVKIAGALLRAQRAMGNATKGSKNPFFKSMYADLNSIREVAIPALNAEGITVLQPTDVLGSKNVVETTLLHESGEWVSSQTEIKNTKGDAQSEGSGISYARRYGLQSLLNIGAVDDDGEAAVGRDGDSNRVQAEKTVVTVNKPQAVPRPVETGRTTAPTKAKSPPVNANTAKTLVEAAFTTLQAQGKVTTETFKEKYLGGVGLSKHTDASINEVLTKLKTDFKELGL